MSNKINKRLILYQAPRHQECYKASVKHGFTPSTLNYSASNKTQKFFGKAHNRAQIRKLSYSLESAQSNKTFILLASALTNVKTLCLTINVPDIEKYRKIIKRFFLRKRRITAFKLILKDNPTKPTFSLLILKDDQKKLTFPWKALGVLRNLASLKVWLQINNILALESLWDFFKPHRKPLPKIKSQHIFLELKKNSHLRNLQTTLEVITSLEAEARKHAPCKLGLDLCGFSRLEESELASLSSVLDNAQSFASMKLYGDFLFGKQGEDLIKSLAKAQQLEELSCIISPNELNKSTDLFLDALMKLEACKKLQLSISGITEPSIDKFLLGLQRVSHLQCLSLSFDSSQRTLSSSLVTLGEMLGKMQNLRDLTLLCQLLFDTESVESLFERLRECQNLERLCLNFYGQSKQISNREFLKLCGSLQNLKNLKAIDLNIGLNFIIINEELLEVWKKTLENVSKNMADFSLNIANFVIPIKPSRLSKFVESCGLLKSASTLKLSFLFWDIETEFPVVLEKLVYHMKSLDSFILQLWTLDDRVIAQTALDNLNRIQEKLSYKIFINWYIKRGGDNLDP